MIAKTLVLVLGAGMAATASAGQIAISDIGGGIVLNSGPLTNMAFGNEQQNWITTSLAAVHASLNADGISTDGRITFLAADTAQGLAVMALIDQELAEGSPILGHVHMDSVANGYNLAYLKDTAGNITVTPNGPNARIASGNFAWNSNGGGDAFAWAGLLPGNATTFRFNKLDGMILGLNDPGTFQFVNWDGSAWKVISVPSELLSFTDSNDYAFSASVLVPAPSGIAVAAGPLMGALLVRRRRNR